MCRSYLAGDLNPENAVRAIAEVGPFGLDVGSGARINGKLDSARLERLMAAVAHA